jgi:hypothetical protein
VFQENFDVLASVRVFIVRIVVDSPQFGNHVVLHLENFRILLDWLHIVDKGAILIDIVLIAEIDHCSEVFIAFLPAKGFRLKMSQLHVWLHSDATVRLIFILEQLWLEEVAWICRFFDIFDKFIQQSALDDLIVISRVHDDPCEHMCAIVVRKLRGLNLLFDEL